MKKYKVFIFIALIFLAWLTRGLFSSVPTDIVVPIDQVFKAGDTLDVMINGTETGLMAERETYTVYVSYGEVR